MLGRAGPHTLVVGAGKVGLGEREEKDRLVCCLLQTSDHCQPRALVDSRLPVRRDDDDVDLQDVAGEVEEDLVPPLSIPQHPAPPGVRCAQLGVAWPGQPAGGEEGGEASVDHLDPQLQRAPTEGAQCGVVLQLVVDAVKHTVPISRRLHLRGRHYEVELLQPSLHQKPT